MSYRPICTEDWYWDWQIRTCLLYRRNERVAELRKLHDKLNASFERLDRILERWDRRLDRYFVL